MDDDARLLDIANAIADGTPVDWPAFSSTANSEPAVGILLRLQYLERVARGHEVIRTHGPESGSTSSRSTLLTEARKEGRLTHDDPLRVYWGPLVVLEKIGRGSFGDVYRARDPRLDRDVALKLIPESAADTASPAIEEGRLLARVRHPNVLTVFGAERIDGRAGIWTEYVRGETLASEIARRGSLTSDEAARVGLDVCRALGAVHAAGVLHRDVKPQNILRDETGRLVLGDFGTGVELDDDTGVADAQIAGTPLYLAPEICAGQPATVRSDLYSVGVLLYFLVTGSHPVRGRTLAEIRQAHASGSRVPLTEARANLPARFVQIVHTLLAREPGDRYDNAGTAAHVLEEVITSPAAVKARLMLLICVVGLLIIVATGAAIVPTGPRTIHSPGNESQEQTARRVWGGADVGFGGTLTADGRYLSFQKADTGDLAIRDFSTNTSRSLTDTGGWAASGDYTAQSVVSSDGRSVVYHWFIEKDNAHELRSIATATNGRTSPRILLRVERGEYIVPVGLTPEGGRVVVLRTLSDKTNQIGLVSTSDGSYTPVKSLGYHFPRGASLSPDGLYLAYDVPTAAGSPRDILVLALDGSGETVGVSGPADDLRPIWTADGSRVVFVSDRGGTPSLWSVAVQNGRSTRSPSLLKANIGTILPIGISQAGALLYAVTGASRRNVYSAPIEEFQVTTEPSLMTYQFVNESSGPAWSPDGQSLAFFSFRARPTLVIRSAASGAERAIAAPQGLEAPFFAGPKWFPNGGSVLVLAADARGSGRTFYRVAIDTGAAEPLHHTDGRISSYALSRDGETIFWSVQSIDDGLPIGPSGKLARYDIAAKRESMLKRGEWFIAVAVSPDGRELAYLKTVRTDRERQQQTYPSVVEVIPSRGGPAREVFRDAIWLSGSRYNTLAWTPDGRFLIFVRDDGHLWRVPAHGGKPQDIGLTIKGRIKSPSINPGGTRIAFGTAEADDNEIWALENFLPSLSAVR